MKSWLSTFELSHPTVVVHELGVQGVYAVTNPDDKRVALITPNHGRIILTPRQAKAVCNQLVEIMEIFARP